MTKHKVSVSFLVVSEFEVDEEDLSQDYNLGDPDELQEAIEDYVYKYARPGVYYQDYSGKHPMVLIPDVKASYEIGWADENEQFKVELIKPESETEE